MAEGLLKRFVQGGLRRSSHVKAAIWIYFLLVPGFTVVFKLLSEHFMFQSRLLLFLRQKPSPKTLALVDSCCFVNTCVSTTCTGSEVEASASGFERFGASVLRDPQLPRSSSNSPTYARELNLHCQHEDLA